MTKNVFAYVRVSTLKQGEGVSLQEQRRAIEEYTRRSGLSIEAWFEEKETAAKRGRRAFGEMLSLLRRGKASGIVLHKIDRGARNLKDWADLGELIDQGIAVHLAGDNLDLGSRGGRLSADIQAVVASDYIRNLREETKKGINGRLRQGLLPFAAPLGYLNCGGGKPKVIDPERAPLVRLAFELYATGRFSHRTLRDELHARGLRTRKGRRVLLDTYSKMLNNPFYIGLIQLRGSRETFLGAHEALIPKALFDAVHDRLRGKAPNKVRTHELLFRRLFRCALCQKLLIGEIQKGHIYYRCHSKDCPGRCVREEVLDQAVRAKLASLHFSDVERPLLDHALRTNLKDEGERRLSLIRAADLQLSQVRDRLARLTDALVDGVIEKETFDDRKRLLLLERREIEDRRAALDGEGAAGQVNELVELADTALLSYDTGLSADKRSLIETIMSNRELRVNEPYIELFSSFRLIEERGTVRTGGPQRGTSRSMKDVPNWAPLHLAALLEGLTDIISSTSRQEKKTIETQT